MKKQEEHQEREYLQEEDAVTGAATVILAMEAGKKAAAEINNYLKNK